MIKNVPLIKGSHYRFPLVYHGLTLLKLGKDNSLRFRIAAEFVNPHESVLDVCGATAALMRHLPEGCTYVCLDASRGLTRHLSVRNIPYQIGDITQESFIPTGIFDVAVMVISLCHFRGDALDDLLESMKSWAGRVVIIEEVLERPRGKNSIVQKTINHLSETDYYKPKGLFTGPEFAAILRKHGYRHVARRGRYEIGVFSRATRTSHHKTGDPADVCKA